MSIEPRLGGGTRDYLPEDMIPRQKMLDAIREVFELFGFVPLDTPGLELEETLTGADPNFRMQIFRAGLRGSEDETLALRFDLTVPLARVVAQYGEKIGRPFKRYQSGKVWRGEKPQAGRFREFVQFDADIVGSNRMSADAEIIAVMYETMRQLGFENFLIRVNNRKILNGLSEYVGFSSEQTPSVLRLIDKLDKVEWSEISEEMKNSLGFTAEQVSNLSKFLDLKSGDQEETIRGVRELMPNSPTAMEGVRELEEIMNTLKGMGVPDKSWKIDLSVARGLGYYTGPVFETILTDLPAIGSVFSGGRYDDLVERFGSANVPAVGASVGVDRLFAAMEKLALVKRERSTAKVLVLNFESQCESVCAGIAADLRRNGVPTELYLGKEVTLKGQLSYGVSCDYKVVIVIGGREKDSGMAQVKGIVNRSQEMVLFADVPEAVKKILS
jgi:histidyl-tRNA synthetase